MQPSVEVRLARFRLAAGMGVHLLVAGLDLGLQPMLLALRFLRIPAQDVAHSLPFHLPDGLTEQAQLQRPLTQQAANLGVGQRRDIPHPRPTQRLLPLALDHPPVPHEDQLFHSKLLLQDLDLVHHGGGITAVPFEHPHRQRLAFLVRQQADDNLQLAPLPVPVVTVLPQLVLLPFQIAARHVVEKQPGRLGATLQVAAIQAGFDLLLPGRQIIQGSIQIVLVKLPQPQHFRHRLILGPAHGGEARALVSDAGQDQEQSEFRQPAVTERGTEAQRLGDLLEHQQEAEAGSQLRGQGELGSLVELAAQQAAEGFDADGGPVGEVGKGAVLNLAVLAKGFPEEEGGRGVAVGDGGDIHDFYIS